MSLRRYLILSALTLSLVTGCTGNSATTAGNDSEGKQAPKLEVLKVGVTQVTERSYGMATALAIVKNTSKKQSGTLVVNYTLYDEGNQVLAQEEVSGQVLRAGQTMIDVTPIHIGDSSAIGRISAKVALKDPKVDTQPKAAYTTNDVHYQPSNSIGVGKVVGAITSTYRATLSDVYLAVICYNNAGEFNGGDFTYLDIPIPASGTQAFEIDVNTIGKPDKCEAYATPSAISQES